MIWFPAAREFVARVAEPPAFSVPVPSVAVPEVKVMAPVGIPEPEAGKTLAVNVTLVPVGTVLALALSRVEVTSMLTVTLSGAEAQKLREEMKDLREKRDASRKKPAAGAEQISRSINALYQDRGGRLWVGTSKGLYVKQGAHFEAVPIAGVAEIRGREAIDSDASGRVYVATPAGLMVGGPGHWRRIWPDAGAAPGAMNLRPILAARASVTSSRNCLGRECAAAAALAVPRGLRMKNPPSADVTLKATFLSR